MNKRQITKVLSDPLLFISRLSIVDKRGHERKLKPNAEQIRIIQSLGEGRDTLILKPRQIGSTTIVAAFFFWQIYTSSQPQTHIILSHKMASAKHIFEIHRRFYASLPPALKRPLAVETSTQMQFADTGATIQAVSSGGDGGLRSFTASSIHISEFAFTPNADELKATAIAALNGGQLCIESTADTWGDPLHREIGLHDAGLVDWEFLFFPWTDHDEYRTPPPHEWEGDRTSALDLDQQWWAHKMRGRLGDVKFRREYPLTVEDAYAQTDSAWIDNSILTDIQVLRSDPDGLSWSQPQPGDKYGIGVDTGAGTGGDASAYAVVSARTGAPVEIKRSNRHTPTEWAEVVAAASRKWGGARVCCESNGTWGGVVITELKHMGVPLWKDSEGRDWTTNAVSKPQMLEALKDAISRRKITVLDSGTVGELRSFKIDERGAPFCPRGLSHHGDSVIALALGMVAVSSINLPSGPFLPQWIQEKKRSDAMARAAKTNYRRY
jgi:hypothetical protein